MKYIDVDSLEVGMVLGEDILDETGTLMALHNAKLTEHIIDTIKKLNFTIVAIDDQPQVKQELLSKDEKDKLIQYVIRYINKKDFYGRRIFNEVNHNIMKVVNQLIVEESALYTISRLKEINDYTFNHALNVCMLSGVIAKWMKMSDKEIELATLCGIFHQIGKLKIDKTLLNKSNGITDDQLAEIKKYPIYTKNVISELDICNDTIIKIIEQSTELLDGSGYPYQLKGDEIHPISKVICVANIFDAAVSDKTYKAAVTPIEISKQLFDMSLNKLSPNVTTPLIKHIQECYHGLKVELSDGRQGEIVYTNLFDPSKPIIKISENELIDISSKGTDLKIVKVITNVDDMTSQSAVIQ